MAGYFDTSVDRTTDELLEAVVIGVKTGINQNKISFAITPFAVLLVKLSQDAEKTARRVVCLTWALVALTVALLGLTAYLAWHEANQQTNQHSDLNAKSSAQQAQPQPTPMPKQK